MDVQHEGQMQTVIYNGQVARATGENMGEYVEQGSIYGAAPSRPTSGMAGETHVDNDKTPVMSGRQSVNEKQSTLEVQQQAVDGHGGDSKKTLLSPFQTAKSEVERNQSPAHMGTAPTNGNQQPPSIDDTPQQTPSHSQTPTEQSQQQVQPMSAQQYPPGDYMYRGHPHAQYVSYVPQHYGPPMPHSAGVQEGSYAQAVTQNGHQGMPPPPPGTHYIPVTGVYPPPPPMAPGHYADPQYMAYPHGAPGVPPYGYSYAYPQSHSAQATTPSTAPGDRFGSSEPNAHPGVVFARSNDPRIVRPKVKLTHEDKRRIVEIARSNSSLRQEDIAQQYGVDRSTISKILISSHRWTGPAQTPAMPLPKPVKHTGGRFPAIEQRMHEWMDAQHNAGYEIRDSIAREKAKEIARMMGFTDDRFKASAKWLDKFKERRKLNGQRSSVTASHESTRPQLQSASDGVAVNFSPISVPPAFTTAFGHPMYWNSASNAGSPSGSQIMPRSQSSVTLSSTDSNSLEAVSMRQQYQHANRSESDIATGMNNSVSDVSSAIPGMHGRQRSRSSPRPQPGAVAQPGNVDPASGRAPRATVSGLQRQNSYHGIASPSPRRSDLNRTHSTAGSISSKRQGKPASLAASAFGLTPVQTGDGFTPAPSPSIAVSNHSRRSEIQQGMQPFTHSMSGMAISPETVSSSGTMSTSSSSQSVAGHPAHGPPITPLQPSGYSNIVPHGHTVIPPGVQYYQVQMPEGHAQEHPPQQHYTYVYAHPGYPPYPAQLDPKQPVSWREE
ncbi:hypothetical protein QFC22_003281 [Naganishia vaughanmartiniae]|uniref:Uncharacterized protein n=1 Tax=Naganishia vaughanmartiniae TaxID=1424756 RepID=A0ACC2X6P3_9TREE|nr:hypothetical protein QFC22_003281 [Naganishia vaughanmartiniae]